MALLVIAHCLLIEF